LAASNKRNGIDLYQRVLREPRHLHGGPRWRSLLEVLAIDFIHRAKISHILKENRAANDLFQTAARSLKNRYQIFQHAIRLRRDVPGNDLLRRRINCDLP
jgi:hypothetical protein